MFNAKLTAFIGSDSVNLKEDYKVFKNGYMWDYWTINTINNYCDNESIIERHNESLVIIDTWSDTKDIYHVSEFFDVKDAITNSYYEDSKGELHERDGYNVPTNHVCPDDCAF